MTRILRAIVSAAKRLYRRLFKTSSTPVVRDEELDKRMEELRDALLDFRSALS